ncbi:MAG: di-heme oxidoredictase family protein [Stellaceae bacterium]
MTYFSTGTVAGTLAFTLIAGSAFSQSARAPASRDGPQDPGVRGGAAAAGGSISGLDAQSTEFFETALDIFKEVDGVAEGLGPRFNLDSCAGCHTQPAVGGTSPAVNPQIAAATANGALNKIPKFVTGNGPVREARFISDGGVHNLFTIAGRADALGCSITQPDFDRELANGNVIFRIPTPLFGLGLVENTPDQNLMDDVAAVADKRSALGITGHFNYTGNDDTITRFGWKAQNKSLMIFAGEAYNVEMGVTNELFPNEREYEANCQYNTLTEDGTDIASSQTLTSVPDVTLFTTFMRLLAAPSTSAAGSPAIRGKQVFNNAGCNLCHIESHTTAPSGFAGLNQVTYSPFSDFQVHNMGVGLQDQITQGAAKGNEFRTAPLWGLGQRIFFLHDGRTDDLLQAILEHGSQGSEANGVIANFQALSPNQKQDLLNFLRSL